METQPEETIPTARMLRIAYIVSHCPYGASSGARIRTRKIGDILRRIGDVSLVIAAQEDVALSGLEQARATYTDVTVVPVHNVPLSGWLDRLRHECDPGFLNTHGMIADGQSRGELLDRLDHYDVVWIHTARTANAFGVVRWERSVLDIDDLPSQLYGSMASASPSLVRRQLDRRMARIWRARERQFSARFTTLAVCSEEDRRSLAVPEITHVVRNGFDMPESEPIFSASGMRRLGFIGLIDYPPNRDGLDWFLRRVWPGVRRVFPEARLRIIGRGCDQALLRLGDGVDALGYLDDPAEEMATWSATIVPLRFGGGTRVKIAEAFSRKCPVVSTTLGAFGYEVTHERELMLADKPDQFSNACVRLLDGTDLGRHLADSAWRRFRSEWSWEAVARAVEATVDETLLRQSKSLLGAG